MITESRVTFAGVGTRELSVPDAGPAVVLLLSLGNEVERG